MADTPVTDAPEPASEDQQEAPLTQAEHLVMAGHHAVAAEGHAHLAAGHLADANGGEPRGMERFAALSAETRRGFTAGTGAQRSFDAMRGRR